MKRQKNPAIEYIRGISMLGVIGIHTGSQYLGNPLANIHLTALFEIVTRFSVPIFFFISAFGLFYNLDLKEKLNYKNFMARRFQTVLVPYLAWSAIYLMHYTIFYRDFSLWSLPVLLKFLFFGFASYQLYFLVILLWFYALMPCWIFLVRRLTAPRLWLLLMMQIAFNYYSSFLLHSSATNTLLKALVDYRLNYWVFHYLFIFLLGGYAAVHYERFYQWLKQSYTKVSVGFFLALSALLLHYYYLLFALQYSPESAINTAHQLSPAGVVYTLAACLFFFAVFSFAKMPPLLQKTFALLGRHSYFAYLFHPFAIFYLYRLLSACGLLMTAPAAIVFYLCVCAVSILAAILARKAGGYFPMINSLLIGVCPKKK